MIKKIILILIVSILTIQTFPTDWLKSIINKSNCIELVSTINAEENADEDTLKNLKFKLIEVDIMSNHRNYLNFTKITYLHYFNSVVINYSNEVICPPPNYI